MAQPSLQQRLKALTAVEFQALGVNHLAYVKPVTVDGKPGWSIHNADGEALTVSVTREVAEVMVRQNDMEPVSLH